MQKSNNYKNKKGEPMKKKKLNLVEVKTKF